MIRECVRCGQPVDPGDRFCSACGFPVPAQDEGEPTGTVVVEVSDTGPVPIVEGLAGLEPGMTVIVMQRGPEVGQRFELAGERMTVGRSADSDVMLDDLTVSRHHAQFQVTEHGWDLVDLGSLNGTYVNRELIERVALTSGDMIQIGKFRMQYLRAPEFGDAGPTPVP